jgi:hypothetical protein
MSNSKSPKLTISPTLGPSNTEVTLSFENLEPNSPITITQSSVVGSSSATADANGNANVKENVLGKPEETVTITAVTGTTGNEVTLAATFKVTK